MDTNRLPKQALQYKWKGRRNIGRPRKRWRDQLHLEDQGTRNMPNPSETWWWWWHSATQSALINKTRYILCFVDGASLYICVTKTNLMHNISSVYFVNQPLHVSGTFVAHHQQIYCIHVYTTNGTCRVLQLTVGRVPSQTGQQTVK
jgi:hypothetical protein